MTDLPKNKLNALQDKDALGACYHCGGELESGHLFQEVLGGQDRQFCCAGWKNHQRRKRRLGRNSNDSTSANQ